MPVDNDGSAALPTFAMVSERSLGWYRSGSSTMALSYGTLSLPAQVWVGSTISVAGGSGFRLTLAPLSAGAFASAGVAYFGEYDSGTTTLQLNLTSGALTIPGATKIAAGGLQVVGSAVSIAGGSGFRLQSIPQIGGAFTDGTLVYIGEYVSAVTVLTINMATGAVFANTGFFSAKAGSATTPTFGFSSETSLGWYRSGVSTLALSYGSFNLSQARTVSMRTLAASSLTPSAANTNTIANECGFTVGGASGASFFINSGGTTYIFNSALSAANA